ncbi:MAG: hypothetical protein COA88_03575 [Kordia sp.]|nr:MAG: hypothetical protein COA88_03575 [Kordia sp.]
MKMKMKKIVLFTFAISFSICGFSQEENDSIQQEKKTPLNKFKDNISASFESNGQWYLNDTKTGIFEEQEHVRANSYLKIDYNFLKHFTVGLQAESYAPEPLLNYDKIYNKKIALGTFYANYKTQKIDITAGYFYEQFGSGLILRSWEDRALGTNNALRGGKIKYSPTNYLDITALYGNQRKGFTLSDSDIFGGNIELNLSEAFKITKINSLSLGVSYVGRKEKYTAIDPAKSIVKDLVNSFSIRADLALNKFYTNIEYVHKGKDARLNNFTANTISFAEEKTFDGSALLWTAGFSQKGIGITYTFRRIENMSFFSERNAAQGVKNPTNQQLINYVPGLTKQHDYTLTNIYTYQAQSKLFLQPNETPIVHAGEIGNQIDVYYKLKKGSLLGGKYGTALSANFSYWADLTTKVSDPDGILYFPSDKLTYKSDFLNFKDKIFTDLNLEVRKKWSPKLSSIFTYINMYYNKSVLESKFDNKTVKAWIGVAESTYKLGKGKSIRLELQHLSTDDDAKNWLGGTAEFFLNSKFGVYFNDSYNYEESSNPENYKIHFFNAGGSYTNHFKNTNYRVALNYGRQRGGLLCVGGVCRPVSKNTGVTVNLAVSF